MRDPVTTPPEHDAIRSPFIGVDLTLEPLPGGAYRASAAMPDTSAARSGHDPVVVQPANFTVAQPQRLGQDLVGVLA